MSQIPTTLAVIGLSTTILSAQVPDNLVVEGIPPIPAEIRQKAERYLDFRAASFQGWHPTKREMLVVTRFGETPQLHAVKFPGGARKQLTFLPEPVGGAGYQPKEGRYVLFSQDKGGGEFFQLYRFDPGDGSVSLLTDGKSRNTGASFSPNGDLVTYTSTRRNGRDTDLYQINPAEPGSDQMLLQLEGGGWAFGAWSRDENLILGLNYVSINESSIHLVDRREKKISPISRPGKEKVSYSHPDFSQNEEAIFVVSDKDSDYRHLAKIQLKDGKEERFGPEWKYDVESCQLSRDRRKIALVLNMEGASSLKILDAASGLEIDAPKLPHGVISGLEWHENNRDLGFTFASAKSPSDAYSLDLATGKVERWTESEISGLNSEYFVEPRLVKFKSFDGLEISSFVYSPDPKKFPGRRPLVISIHGGPESQARPGFQARNNFYLNELGIAVVYPNVRGSSGYGKTFLTLDNGLKREDSVKDIGALLDWIGAQPYFDASKVAVMGGSYGGYMVLASLIHHGQRIKAGVDVVGISNFLTFLKNTQDYRRDLRRVEYGDERDPEMRAFLEKISPSNHASKISQALFVVQGKNDPRVPLAEAEQIVKAVRENGGKVWYLMAKDEGHGFARKRNQDFQFLSTILFLQDFLLAQP